MGAAARIGVVLVALLLAGGCADVPRRPLDPAAAEAQLRARSLVDPELRDLCVERLGAPAEPWPPSSVDLPTLALAAWRYRPEMAAARARVEAAETAAGLAGRLPNPSLSVTPGRVTSTDASPWVVAAALDLTIPLGGKREKLRAVADQEVELARLDAAGTAWQVYAEVRDALTEHVFASDLVYALANESRHRAERFKLAQERVAAGFAPRGEAQTARSEADRTDDELAQASAEFTAARTRLAAAAGLLTLDLVNLDEPPFTDAPIEGRVVDRLDVRRALAEHEAAERSLELELARQYPDLHLGPGYEYDQGARKYLLGVGMELPLFDRNQVGIAAALAHRDASAARFETLQSAALAQMAIAHDSLDAMRRRVQSVHGPVRRRAQDRVATAIQAFQAGATDALSAADAHLEFDAYQRVAAEAKRAWLRAQAAWEDATQRPFDPRLAAIVPMQGPAQESSR